MSNISPLLINSYVINMHICAIRYIYCFLSHTNNSAHVRSGDIYFGYITTSSSFCRWGFYLIYLSTSWILPWKYQGMFNHTNLKSMIIYLIKKSRVLINMHDFGNCNLYFYTMQRTVMLIFYFITFIKCVYLVTDNKYQFIIYVINTVF